MENTSDSQMSNASHSLSLPSEPPDIRNWFPSYRYESFVLDTYEFKERECEGDGFSAAAERSREKEGHLGESRRNGDAGDKHEHQSLNGTTDSTYSLSILSEPPHVRNWFSSYVYESPVLDTLDDFKESVTKERVCAKEGFAYEGSEGKKEDNFEYESRNSWNSNEVDAGGGTLASTGPVNCENTFEDTCVNQPSNAIPDSSEAPSSLSEPTDIRHWFFSYAYEYPEGNGLVDKEADSDGLVNQHNHNEKESNLGKFGQTRVTGKSVVDEKVFPKGSFFSSLMGDKQESSSLNKGMRTPVHENSSTQDNLFCECSQRLEDKIFPNHPTCSTNDLEKVSSNDDCTPHKLQQKQNFVQEPLLVTCQKTNSCKNDMTSPTKLSLMKDLTENLKTKAEMGVDLASPTTNGNFTQVAGDLIRKSTGENKNKENEGKEVESGFVTTKNRWIPNDENSLHKPQKNLSECSRNKRITSDCGNNTTKRKVLSERTNLERSNAVEITGKWLCPQKTNPNIGPPLKQLRLERWVHRL